MEIDSSNSSESSDSEIKIHKKNEDVPKVAQKDTKKGQNTLSAAPAAVVVSSVVQNVSHSSNKVGIKNTTTISSSSESSNSEDE